MPLPMNHLQIESAVTSALEKVGAIPVSEEAISALKDAGADVHRLATELASLVFSAKDRTKLEAIRDAMMLHGINLKTENRTGSQTPTININIVSENTNLNNLFAPER